MDTSFKLLIIETNLTTDITLFRHLIEELEVFYNEEIKKINEEKNLDPGLFIQDFEEIEEREMILDELESNIVTKQIYLRYGTLMSLYSFLEISLLKLSNFIKETNNIALKPSELQGKGIKKYKLYLEKVVGLDLSHLKATWDNLCHLSEVRNQVAHNNGLITKKSESEIKIRNIKNVSITAGGYIIVSEEFLTESLKNVSNYISNLINLIAKSIRNKN